MINKQILKNIPNKTGVYLFKNKNDENIYVGKAKNLKKRVSSYFLKNNLYKEEKIFKIVTESENLDYIITSNEEEALILEANLIYSYKPKYNFMLKDTKIYPYILITKEKYPSIRYNRNKNVVKGSFFGPYPDVRFVKDIIDILQRVYKVRTCDRSMDRISKPCFLYHLDKCFGPCNFKVDPEIYNSSVDNVFDFLKGNVEKVKSYINKMMNKYSDLLEFEKAAQMRNVLSKLDNLFIKLGVELKYKKNIDVIVSEKPIYLLLKIRKGYLVSKLSFTLDSDLNEFFHQFYIVRKNEIPDEINTLYKEEIESDILEHVTKNGLKRIKELNKNSAIYKLAFRNLEEEIKKYTDISNLLLKAKNLLGLKNKPLIIEGIDISHLQGLYTVASLIRFENGVPIKNKYRKYRLDHFNKPNDYESIKYIVKKRYEKHNLPDLLFIDGGKGQVNSAVEALREINKHDVDIVGIAKEDERIVFPGEIQDLHLSLDNPVLRLLIYIRDETHRFAIGFNKSLRSKRFTKTKLDEIPGIGPKRKKTLMTTYGSLEEIKKASLDDLTKILKNKKIAKILIRNLEE